MNNKITLTNLFNTNHEVHDLLNDLINIHDNAEDALMNVKIQQSTNSTTDDEFVTTTNVVDLLADLVGDTYDLYNALKSHYLNTSCLLKIIQDQSEQLNNLTNTLNNYDGELKIKEQQCSDLMNNKIELLDTNYKLDMQAKQSKGQLEDALDQLNNLQQQYNKLQQQYNLAISKVNSMQDQIKQQQIENSLLNIKVNDTANKQNNDLVSLTNNIKNLLIYLDTYKEPVKKGIDFYKNNIKKSKKGITGEGAMAFNHAVDTEELIQDYIKNNYKLTDNIVKKYNTYTKITRNGLRYRLVQAGVWKNDTTDKINLDDFINNSNIINNDDTDIL